jgi:hypothetical protein
MLKKKFYKSLFVGLMALVGLVSGVAFMASAQSQSVTAPSVTANTTIKAQAVDTPEAGDVADNPDGTDVSTATISAGQKIEHGDKAGDKDGSAANEAGEPAGSTDAGE